LDDLEVSRLPASIEGRSFRPVEGEVDKPALAGVGFDPPPFFASWRAGPKVEIGGTRRRHILQLDQRPQRGLVLIRLDLRTGRAVVDRDRLNSTYEFIAGGR
jgi:hypothetical protein